MNIPAILGDKTQHQMSRFTTDHECAIHILGQNFPGAELSYWVSTLEQFLSTPFLGITLYFQSYKHEIAF